MKLFNRMAFLYSVILVVSLSSCARVPVKIQTLNTIEAYPTVPEKVVTVPEVLRSNVVHEVAPGETLWRIGQMYDVEIKDIVRVNNLKDIGKLEKGEKLRIPNAAPLRSVIPLWPSKKWKYIIVHHSATEAGNALSFDHHHIKDRHWKSLGYHFVIDNGTSGKEDGQIEVAPRWLHQDNGAHCKAGNMNNKAIGICLVGNFDEDTVSPNQMESLVFLVKELKRTYNIPDSHILGHGDVKGAQTDCPGKKFPWKEFRSRINR